MKCENSLSLILTCHPNRWWSWGDSVTYHGFFRGKIPISPEFHDYITLNPQCKRSCLINGHAKGTDSLQLPSIPYIYTIYKAYLWGLNFREYPQNSAWKIWYTLTYLHGILKFPSGCCFGTWIVFFHNIILSILYIYGNNHHPNWLSLHHFSEG